MRSYIEHDTFVVALSHQETCRLNDGESFHDRRNPLWTEAKVEVRPYTEFDPTYEPITLLSDPGFAERLTKMRCVAEFFTNTDIVISVLPEVSRYALIAAEVIPRDSVITLVENEEREQLLAALPANGIEIRFDDTKREI